MIFYPISPIYDLVYLVCGVLMIVAASYAIKKVREGSKNKFAYVLLGFTFLLGISYVGEAFTETFLPTNVPFLYNLGIPNLYAYLTFKYLHLLLIWLKKYCGRKIAVCCNSARSGQIKQSRSSFPVFSFNTTSISLAGMDFRCKLLRKCHKLLI